MVDFDVDDAFCSPWVGFTLVAWPGAALARDVCRFAPVITRLAESTAELFKIGAWADWQYRRKNALENVFFLIFRRFDQDDQAPRQHETAMKAIHLHIIRRPAIFNRHV